MSRILHDAAMQSMKEAYKAFLSGEITLYTSHMTVAERTIDAIGSLGTEGICGRQMELMSLQAEWRLLQTLPQMNSPTALIPLYELAELLMLMPPSRIIMKDAPFLPHCTDALSFYGQASEQTAEEIGMAVSLYSKLTGGGGGGVEEIYRAQLAEKLGKYEEAVSWAQLALERMCGDKWIEPIAREILKTDHGLK